MLKIPRLNGKKGTSDSFRSVQGQGVIKKSPPCGSIRAREGEKKKREIRFELRDTYLSHR